MLAECYARVVRRRQAENGRIDVLLCGGSYLVVAGKLSTAAKNMSDSDTPFERPPDHLETRDKPLGGTIDWFHDATYMCHISSHLEYADYSPMPSDLASDIA